MKPVPGDAVISIYIPEEEKEIELVRYDAEASFARKIVVQE